jgi:hypothetical protein
MAPRPPNYSQDRLQRERAQAAKVREKAERRAEEAARRKAKQVKTPEDSASYGMTAVVQSGLGAPVRRGAPSCGGNDRF